MSAAAGGGVVDRFQPTGMGNTYLDLGDYGISFNASPWIGGGVFAADTNEGETALCVAGKWLILNGDFRREFAERADKGGVEACIEFFAAKPELHSSWSNTVEQVRAALAKAGGSHDHSQ